MTQRDQSPQIPQQAVCILGMHRSGTSCLAGMLEEAGLALGDVSKENPYNLKGNQENLQIMRLHDEVLSSNGGSWDNPPAVVSWRDEHRRRRDEIIASYRPFAVWGFKDPRTLLTLEGWRDALPAMRYVATFRHPLAVASSLQSRGGMSFERALELWRAYCEILLRWHSELDFDIVCFDLPRAEYLACVTAAARGLGLTPPAGFAFFEERLRSQRPGPGLPAAIAELHAELQSRAC